MNGNAFDPWLLFPCVGASCATDHLSEQNGCQNADGPTSHTDLFKLAKILYRHIATILLHTHNWTPWIEWNASTQSIFCPCGLFGRHKFFGFAPRRRHFFFRLVLCLLFDLLPITNTWNTWILCQRLINNSWRVSWRTIRHRIWKHSCTNGNGPPTFAIHLLIIIYKHWRRVHVWL